jgi:NAD(P)H-dependent flavin oxidoreductase YrpB (nitropropane dioxygenase family)
MLKVTASLLEILKKTARCLLYRDPDLIENTHRQHSTRVLRAEGPSKWDTVQWIESLGASVTQCGAMFCGTSECSLEFKELITQHSVCSCSVLLC